MTELLAKKCPHATLLYLLLASWILRLPLTCRGTFLFPAFFAQGPLFRPTPSGVLWPKQTFLSQQHKKYHYSTGNGKLATPAEEENSSCGREKRSFLPQHFVKYINSRDGTSWKILNLNSKMFGELICQNGPDFYLKVSHTCQYAC